jgi:hypothetical protein
MKDEVRCMDPGIVNRSVLAVLLIALLLPIPVLSFAVSTGVIYNAGDWSIYRYAAKAGEEISEETIDAWLNPLAVQKVNNNR